MKFVSIVCRRWFGVRLCGDGEVSSGAVVAFWHLTGIALKKHSVCTGK